MFFTLILFCNVLLGQTSSCGIIERVGLSNINSIELTDRERASKLIVHLNSETNNQVIKLELPLVDDSNFENSLRIWDDSMLFFNKKTEVCVDYQEEGGRYIILSVSENL